MNKCIFIGNLTRDPELTMTASNISICKFSIAVNRSFPNQNGEREADFFNIIAWRALGENCAKYLTKGKKVAVVGAMQTRSYEDKEGNKRYVTELVADDVEFLSARNEGESSASSQPYQKTQKMSELEPVNSDDLPF